MNSRRATKLSVSSAVRAVAAAAAAASVALTSITGCVQEPAPFNPRLMQQWERAQANQVKTRPMYPLPSTQESRFVPGETEARPVPLERTRELPEGPPLNMSLQEIVHRAIINKLDVRVAVYDTALDHTRVMEA